MKKSKIRQNFLDWLDDELSEKGWTLRELGRRSGVAISNVSNIRAGKRYPSYNLVAALADGLGQRHEVAFRQCGLLPNINGNKTNKEIIETLQYLDDDQRKDVLQYVQWKKERDG